MSPRKAVDDALVLRAAQSLIEQGIRPSQYVVRDRCQSRWSASAVCDALRRLKESGQLVVPDELEIDRNNRPRTADDREEIKYRLALVRDSIQRKGRSLYPDELDELFGCTSKQERTRGKAD